MTKFFYNKNHKYDVTQMLLFLEGMSKQLGVIMDINQAALESVARNLRIDFPYEGGPDGASSFKKAARFIFLFQELKPITIVGSSVTSTFPKVGDKNVLVAIMIACDAIFESQIHSETNGSLTIENRLQVSEHSLIDITEAISKTSHVVGFKLLCVLLEQMTYKTNPSCQYTTFEL